MTENANPLHKHFRQPAIYIRLPSGGAYWPPGSLDMPPNNELPVYPMTTKDEVAIRTPDGLINGASIVSVFQSCLPNIKDAWNMPNVDVDAVLVAIKIASYGHGMDILSACPHCKHKNEFSIDLRSVLSNISMPDFNTCLEINGLKFKLKPQPYQSVNKVNSLRFDEQKLLQALGDASVDNEMRMERFRIAMQDIVDLNIEVLADSTEYIQLDNNQIVNDRSHIREYYLNSDSKIIKTLQDKFSELSKQSGARGVDVTCESCTKPYTTGLEFDYANFFVQGF